MKNFIPWLRLVMAVAISSLAASAACAQKGDWQAVENLKPGTVVSVKTRHRYPCTVDRVTSDALFCERSRPFLVPIRVPSSFSRAEIREVRLEHNQSKDAWIGAGVGAAAGASLGAASNHVSRFGGGLFGGLGGGMVGALVGATIPIVHHKQVIYKR